MPQDRQSLKIFVSYSYHDEDWRRRLFDQYLQTPLGDCLVWSDTLLRVGDHWFEEIDHQLQTATLAVLLVSPRFLASDFIMKKEYPVLFARAQNQGLRIVWIPVDLKQDDLAKHPAIQALQGAFGFHNALPARPQDCSDELLEQVREHTRQQLVMAVDPASASLGKRLQQRYTIDSWLGAGRMASVYSGRDVVLGRRVAIKLLKDADNRQAFMDDVQAAMRTSEQPNFINVYDSATHEEAACCVVQLVDGDTLRDRMAEYDELGGLPLPVFRKVFTRIAGAMARAHAMGVTYGNLKPSNIILGAHDEPFILPVGRKPHIQRERQRVRALVAQVAACRSAKLPLPLSTVEDLAYLVPDHFDDEVDEYKVDQYMLGLLAWQMATGRWPDAVANPERLPQAGVTAFAELLPITALRPLCPQFFSGLVAKMVARRPSRRFQTLGPVLSAADLLADLGLLIARDSYRRCAAVPGFDTDFFDRFYAEFHRVCPGAEHHFSGFGSEAWARQHRMLKEAVLLLFAYQDQHHTRVEPNVLSRIAGSHGAVDAAFYAPFRDALITTVCGDPERQIAPYDPRCTDPILRDKLLGYWIDALSPGIDYLESLAPRAAARGS